MRDKGEDTGGEYLRQREHEDWVNESIRGSPGIAGRGFGRDAGWKKTIEGKGCPVTLAGLEKRRRKRSGRGRALFLNQGFVKSLCERGRKSREKYDGQTTESEWGSS